MISMVGCSPLRLIPLSPDLGSEGGGYPTREVKDGAAASVPIVPISSDPSPSLAVEPPVPSGDSQKPEGVDTRPSALSGTLLACIASFEQGVAGYATETGNGFSGRYQFSPSTWLGAVTEAGYSEWAERPASEAPAVVQDAAALRLLARSGLGPWPPAARYCTAEYEAWAAA